MLPWISPSATPAHASLRFLEDFDALPVPPASAAAGAADAVGAARDDAARAAAIATARAEGFAAGEREATRRATEAQRLAADRALALLAETIRAEAEAARAQAEAAADSVARLLLTGLRALFPARCARHGAAEAAAVARAVLPRLWAEPALLVQSAPDAAEALRAELDRLPTEQAGRVTCLVSAAMRPGDLRVEWRGGVAERDTKAVMEALEAALEAAGFGDAPPEDGA